MIKDNTNTILTRLGTYRRIQFQCEALKSSDWTSNFEKGSLTIRSESLYCRRTINPSSNIMTSPFYNNGTPNFVPPLQQNEPFPFNTNSDKCFYNFTYIYSIFWAVVWRMVKISQILTNFIFIKFCQIKKYSYVTVLT